MLLTLLQSGYYADSGSQGIHYSAAMIGMYILIIVIGIAGYAVQARLHGVTGDADHDDQYVHSDHGCGVVDSLRTRIRVISRLKQGQKHVCHSLTVFSVCVVSARLLGGHQYHFINVHMGR